MLESVVRLSEAHAKLMHRKTVEVMDVIVATTLIECSLNRTLAFGSVNAFFNLSFFMWEIWLAFLSLQTLSFQ